MSRRCFLRTCSVVIVQQTRRVSTVGRLRSLQTTVKWPYRPLPHACTVRVFSNINGPILAPQLFRAGFSTTRYKTDAVKPQTVFNENVSEKEFSFKKALLVRKVTRYEYEKDYLNPKLNEAELREYLASKGSDYDTLRLRHDEYFRCIDDIQEALVKKGIDYKLIHRYDYDKSLVDWADVIFTAGGDGTFLLAASKVAGRTKPVIGIVTDPQRSVGYLCLPHQSSKNMNGVLDKLITGDFSWFWRQRLRLTMYGKHTSHAPYDLYQQQLLYPEHRYWEHVQESEQFNKVDHPDFSKPVVLPVLALNEVFIGETLSSRVSFYEISIDGSSNHKQKSSGVTICPGTGSTSWYFNISNISKLTAREILRIAQKHHGCTNARLQDDELLHKVITEFNNALVFSPSELKMAYCIRDPLSSGIYQISSEPRGFCNRMWVKSRMWDACVVVDGSLSFSFNNGAVVEVDVNQEDALRCVRLH